MSERKLAPCPAPAEGTKFLLLAAGRGSRFRQHRSDAAVSVGLEETVDSTKLTARLDGKSLPQHAVEFAARNGAERVHVTLGHGREADQIRADVESAAAAYDIALSVRTQDPDLYGTAAALLPWQTDMRAPLVVLFGDNFYRGTLPAFSDPAALYFTYSTARDLLTARHVQDVHPHNRYAAVLGDRIVEKPHDVVEGPFFTGLLRLPCGFLTSLTTEVSPRGEMEITEAVNAWQPRIPVRLVETGLVWGDLTYQPDVESLNTLVAGNPW